MRALIVWQLQQEINNPFSKKAKRILEDNPFTDNVRIVAWLIDLFKRKINGRKKFPLFPKAITPTVQAALDSGDVFYSKLFNDNGFINERNKEKELPNPLTTTVNWIYERLFLNERQYHESLIIYHELQDFVESEAGKVLGKDQSFQTFKKWSLIDVKLEVEHTMYESWFNSIPLKSIIKEKNQFLELNKGFKLAEIANIYVSSRNNVKIAKDHISRLRLLKSKPSYEFIKEATRSSEYVHFKSKSNLQRKLIYRLGLKEFLQFVDSLKYPIVQDYALSFLNELNDFTAILKYMVSTVKLKTRKEYLLLMILQNYFNFLFHTLNDLNGIAIQKYNESEDAKPAKEQAKNLYEKWINELVPQSFNTFLDILFKKKELRGSRYFLLFFQWINDYSKLYITNPGMNAKGELIDLLNESFQKRLDQHIKDRHFLIDNTDLRLINYEALKKLVSIYYENKTDTEFRDKLYNLYLNYIASESFSWHAQGNINFNEAINIPYYFSLVLESYPDALGKWNSIFEHSKTEHEGWAFTKANHKLYDRESFLLSSGIGLAYSRYIQNESANTKEMLFEVLGKILQQHRYSSGSKTIDYLTPLLFAAITIREFARDAVDEFILLLCKKLDDLKILLRCLHELIDDEVLYATTSSKKEIKNRIKEEFWVIENNKSDRELHELKYYSSLIEEIQKAMKKKK